MTENKIRSKRKYDRNIENMIEQGQQGRGYQLTRDDFEDTQSQGLGLDRDTSPT
jgi:hypothetical protein